MPIENINAIVIPDRKACMYCIHWNKHLHKYPCIKCDETYEKYEIGHIIVYKYNAYRLQ